MALRKLLLILSLFIIGDCFGQSPMFKLIAKRQSSCSYLLDQYSGAAAAYSLRKLDVDYAGSAIRVRRSSDNTEQDIGFTGSCGDLDTVALKTFVGTGGTDDGFIVTFYDQSGNGNNLGQSTAGNQPNIMDNGVVLRDGGKVAILFDGSNDYLTVNIATNITTTNLTLFTVFNKTSAGVFGNSFSRVFSFMLSSTNADYETSGWAAIHRNGSTLSNYKINVAANSSWVANTRYLSYSRLDGGTVYIAINGASATSTSGATNSINTGCLQMGTQRSGADGSDWFNGYIQEVVLYNSDKSGDKSNIESNINTYYSVY